LNLCFVAPGPVESSRLAAFTLLGALRALELDLVKVSDIEYRLFIPLVWDRLKECGVLPEIVDVAEGGGIELATCESISREMLLPFVKKLQDQLVRALETLKAESIDPTTYWVQP
jgi:hypothetical protein